jgi:hypothetical protein
MERGMERPLQNGLLPRYIRLILNEWSKPQYSGNTYMWDGGLECPVKGCPPLKRNGREKGRSELSRDMSIQSSSPLLLWIVDSSWKGVPSSGRTSNVVLSMVVVAYRGLCVLSHAKAATTCGLRTQRQGGRKESGRSQCPNNSISRTQSNVCPLSGNS